MIEHDTLVIMDNDETTIFTMVYEDKGTIWIRPHGVTSDHKHELIGGKCRCEKQTLVDSARIYLAPSYSVVDIPKDDNG